jgi:hypothetical protein
MNFKQYIKNNQGLLQQWTKGPVSDTPLQPGYSRFGLPQARAGHLLHVAARRAPGDGLGGPRPARVQHVIFLGKRPARRSPTCGSFSARSTGTTSGSRRWRTSRTAGSCPAAWTASSASETSASSGATRSWATSPPSPRSWSTRPTPPFLPPMTPP